MNRILKFLILCCNEPKVIPQTDNSFWRELNINILGATIGALLFTVILFFLNEYIFRKKNLTGEWKTITLIEKTSLKRYENLKIEYKIHLLQKGYELTGSGEKIKDIKPDGSETVFFTENRVNVDVEGYYERNFLGKSKVYLNIFEEGRKRDTRATYILTITDDKNLAGTFISTAANASGKINMTKS